MRHPFSVPLTHLALCVGALFLHGATTVMASSHLIYFGTTTRAGAGIWSARLDGDTGVLTPATLAVEATNPGWITFSPDRRFLYAVHGSKAQAIGFKVEADGSRLTPLPPSPLTAEASGGPSHLAVDRTGRALVAANYGGGTIAIMSIRPDGSLGTPTVHAHSGHGPNPQRQEKPHPHSVTISPDNRFVIVCDLGLDRIFSYALDAEKATLTPANPPFIETPPTLGPRHFKFSVDGRFAYAVTEMGATVEAYRYEASHGSLTPIGSVSLLPAGYQAKWAAEVRVHPNGRFLYASNRGHDSIAVCSLDPASGQPSLLEIVPSGGRVPRNFALSPDGKWLVCAHQDSGDVTVFKVDPSSGRLTRTSASANVPGGICVEFFN